MFPCPISAFFTFFPPRTPPSPPPSIRIFFFPPLTPGGEPVGRFQVRFPHPPVLGCAAAIVSSLWRSFFLYLHTETRFVGSALGAFFFASPSLMMFFANQVLVLRGGVRFFRLCPPPFFVPLISQAALFHRSSRKERVFVPPGFSFQVDWQSVSDTPHIEGASGPS